MSAWVVTHLQRFKQANYAFTNLITSFTFCKNTTRTLIILPVQCRAFPDGRALSSQYVQEQVCIQLSGCLPSVEGQLVRDDLQWFSSLLQQQQQYILEKKRKKEKKIKFCYVIFINYKCGLVILYVVTHIVNTMHVILKKHVFKILRKCFFLAYISEWILNKWLYGYYLK